MATNEKDSVNKKISIAVIQLTSRSAFIKLLSFIGQVFVARILLPSDFGVFAVLAFFITFASVFSDFGSSWIIVQNKDGLTQEEISTLFFLKVFSSIILIGVLWVIAPLLPLYLKDFSSQYVLLLRIYSVSLLLTSMKNVPLGLIERKMQYARVAFMEILGVIVYQIVAIILTLNGFGVWSLVWGVLMKEVTELLIAFAVSKWIPSLIFKLEKILQLLKNAVYLQTTGMLNLIHAAILPILVGRFSGVTQIGYLDWAISLAAIPTFFTDSYARAAFAGLSRLQNATATTKNIVHHSILILSMLIGFFITVVFGLGSEIISIIYSVKWLPALLALQMFVFATSFYGVSVALGALLLSRGLYKSVFKIHLAFKVIEWLVVLGFYPLLSFLAVPLAAIVSSLLNCLLYSRTAFRHHLLDTTWIPKYISIILVTLLIGIGSKVSGNWLPVTTLLFLVCKGFVIFVVYATVSWFILKKELIDIYNYIFKGETSK